MSKVDPRKIYELQPRCPKCRVKCQHVNEELTRSDSRILLCEANTLNRKYRIGEAERQLLIWANSAPPLKISSPPTVIDPILLEKSKIMLNGSVRLRRPVDHTLKIESDNDDMEVSESDSSC